jgi:hypothetical protein
MIVTLSFVIFNLLLNGCLYSNHIKRDDCNFILCDIQFTRMLFFIENAWMIVHAEWANSILVKDVFDTQI